MSHPPCQWLPLAAAPPTRPARRGSPVDTPRSQAERGAAQSGQAAQDGIEEGQQWCPGAPSGKMVAAGAVGNMVACTRYAERPDGREPLISDRSVTTTSQAT